MKQLFTIGSGFFFWFSSLALGQWNYSEKLHLIAGPEIIEAGAKYEALYGEDAVQVGGRAHGVLDSKDENAWSALALLQFSDEEDAWSIGAGFQQRDPDTSTAPVVELALTPWFWGYSRTQFYAQYEWDGLGVGFGIRLEWTVDIANRVDADLSVDASWFEELEEDVDGYAAIFFEPSVDLPVLHLGPAIWLDEEEVALGAMIMIRP